MAETPITPTTPTTPIVGQGTPKRKTAMELRREALQRISQTQQPIFRRIYQKTIQKGSLVTFNYTGWKHDPYPLILCSGVYADGKVAGINLHYLTFRYIRFLIQQYCGKAFSYPLIKGNLYISNAFRAYRRTGIRTAKVLDCEFLMTVLGTVRSFKPTEVEAIRQEIQRQLRAKINPTAEELEASTNEYSGTIAPNPRDPRYQEVKGYNPLDNYGSPEWPNNPRSKPKPTLDHGSRLPKDLLPPPVEFE